jgi:hypothetical protein
MGEVWGCVSGIWRGTSHNYGGVALKLVAKARTKVREERSGGVERGRRFVGDRWYAEAASKGGSQVRESVKQSTVLPAGEAHDAQASYKG